MPSPSIYHSGLSATFNGLRHSLSSADAEVWQFRGIKYGNIPARFRQSTLNDSFPEICDASIYGPKCPHAKAPRLEGGTIGLPDHLASHAADIYDEFNCLNLNITSPANVSENSSLPVMVYVHGGGGRSGANSDWWCDGGGLVHRSIMLGNPVILIAINYRLAVLGYLGSSELQNENGKADGGNYGLRDVHTAIAWIHRYIKQFGGNPENITIYGESAGSLAVHAQMHSKLPAYFVRCISQSQTMGTPLLSTPQSVAEKTTVYDAVKSHLGVTSVAQMQAAPWEQLVTAYATCDPKHGMGEQAMIDGEFLDESWANSFKFAGTGSGEAMIGNTGDEGAVVTLLFRAFPTTEPRPTCEAFITAAKTAFPTSKLSPILNAYKISPSGLPTDLEKSLISLIEDIMFYKGTADDAAKLRNQGTKVFQYSFDQRQPFTGPFKGVPGHALDLAYLHGDPSIFAECENPEKELAIQAAMQSSWVAFANGEKPWEEEKTRLFGPDETVKDVETRVMQKTLRRADAWPTLDVLTVEEITTLAGIAFGFYGQLVGLA